MGTAISRSGRTQISTTVVLTSYLALCLLLSRTCSAFTPINKPNPPPANPPAPNVPAPPPPAPPGPAPPAPARPLVFYDLFDVATGDDIGSCQNHLSEIEVWFDEIQEIIAKTVDDLDDYIGPQQNKQVQNALKAFTSISVNTEGTAPALPADQERFNVVKGVYGEMQSFFAGGKIAEIGRPGLFCNDDWLVETDAIYSLDNGKKEENEGFRSLMSSVGTFDNPDDKAFWTEKYQNYRIGAKICDPETLAQTLKDSMRSIIFCPLLFDAKNPPKIDRDKALPNQPLSTITPMSFTLLHELDHLMRPESSDDVPYWGPRNDFQRGQPGWPGPPDEFVNHSPLTTVGVARCLFTAQSKPDLVVENSESIAYLGLTIFLSQFGSDFSTGQARGIGTTQEGPGPAITDPAFEGAVPREPKPPSRRLRGRQADMLAVSRQKLSGATGGLAFKA